MLCFVNKIVKVLYLISLLNIVVFVFLPLLVNKASCEGAKVTTAGRAFQTRTPATEKARRPTVGRLTAGTHRSSEVEVWRSEVFVGLGCQRLMFTNFLPDVE